MSKNTDHAPRSREDLALSLFLAARHGAASGEELAQLARIEASEPSLAARNAHLAAQLDAVKSEASPVVTPDFRARLQREMASWQHAPGGRRRSVARRRTTGTSVATEAASLGSRLFTWLFGTSGSTGWSPAALVMVRVLAVWAGIACALAVGGAVQERAAARAAERMTAQVPEEVPTTAPVAPASDR